MKKKILSHVLLLAPARALSLGLAACSGETRGNGTAGSDADHHAALCKAIRDPADDFCITPDFIAE